MALPSDYFERVYAGVLGKVIGVYLGRPFEGWTYDRIMERLGEVDYYVHDKIGVPLIVTDDDISGTFTFIRAMPDHGNSMDITPAQIGQAWLNYIIKERSILWWGGMGNSTEHTAFLRLEDGIEAPRSGSRELNGKVVSEQIGAQIFIDGWALVSPGDPERAADLARRAASVSHDGEAIYGAQVVAAMEAMAFVESDVDKLIDVAVTLIPKDSVIYQLIADVRGWHAGQNDWRKTRSLIEANYGYDKYGGNCHMVPNHGLIIHALLHGGGDFREALKIVNTCGWDTDCNSGNVGCLMGIKNGLAGIDAGIDSGADWRGPVADRFYMPTADGGRAVTDCVTEALEITNVGRALNGESPLVPKDGAKFHFEVPGSVQGFVVDESEGLADGVRLSNVAGNSSKGERSLKIEFGAGVSRISSSTFVPTKEIAKYFETRGYGLMASPRLHPGQTVRVGVRGDESNASGVQACLVANVFGEKDQLEVIRGPQIGLEGNGYAESEWLIEEQGGRPIATVGIEIDGTSNGCIYLDYLTWDGEADVTLTRPEQTGTMWRRAWVQGVDQFGGYYPESYRLIQNRGTGLLMQGTRDWRNYRVTADVTPHMVKSSGVAVRVQGLRRYYALLLVREGKLQLVKAKHERQVLSEIDYSWEPGCTYEMTLEVEDGHLRGSVNGESMLEADDVDEAMGGGAIALVCEEGRTATQVVRVTGLPQTA